MGGMVNDGDVYRQLGNAGQYETRIKQLERQCATLSAEIDLGRPVIEACQFAVQTGMINSDSGFSLKRIYDAISTYEAAKEQG